MIQELYRKQNVLTSLTKEEDATVKVSFDIAQIIAKRNKPFSDGDYFKYCLTKVFGIIYSEI